MKRIYHVGETVRLKTFKEANAARNGHRLSVNDDMLYFPTDDRSAKIVQVHGGSNESTYTLSAVWYDKFIAGYNFADYMIDPLYFDSVDRITLAIKEQLVREQDRIIRSPEGAIIDVEFEGELPYYIIDSPIIRKIIDCTKRHLPSGMRITKTFSWEELEDYRSISSPELYFANDRRMSKSSILQLKQLIETQGYAVINGSSSELFNVLGLSGSNFVSSIVILPTREEVMGEITQLKEEIDILEEKLICTTKLATLLDKE